MAARSSTAVLTAMPLNGAPTRIGTDTRAYRTGVLTALGLVAEERWLLDTANESGREIASPSFSRLLGTIGAKLLRKLFACAGSAEGGLRQSWV